MKEYNLIETICVCTRIENNTAYKNKIIAGEVKGKVKKKKIICF